MDTLNKTDFPRALRELNLTEQFVALCRGGADTSEILAWVDTKPELKARAFLPISFKCIRQKLGCAGPRGGRRTTGRRSFYSVRKQATP